MEESNLIITLIQGLIQQKYLNHVENLLDFHLFFQVLHHPEVALIIVLFVHLPIYMVMFIDQDL